jgi:putative CRISPR-associated protein (TIGR02619 family)
MKPNLMVSTVGTSVLTNGADAETARLIRQYANTIRLEDIPEVAERALRKRVFEVAEKLDAVTDLGDAAKVSAELNGIIRFYDGRLDSKADSHYLLATDSWIGEEAARVIEEWLRGKGLNVVRYRQSDLRTDDLTTFQTGLSELVKWCAETVDGYRRHGYRVVFNLTGGFKSIQGFLQTLAMFYADETIYIFETGNELLRIPRLPVMLSVTDEIRKHIRVFRRLALQLRVEATELGDIPGTFLLRMDEETALSSWGEIVWDQAKKELYREIHPSPSTELEFGTQFEDSLKNLNSDRLIAVNQKIDQLIRFLETKDPRFNLPSLDFKELRGNPKPPSTHEIDAWADQDAKRIFGHYEKEVFVLDRLDKALH